MSSKSEKGEECGGGGDHGDEDGEYDGISLLNDHQKRCARSVYGLETRGEWLTLYETM
jgi:hypothetical protein